MTVTPDRSVATGAKNARTTVRAGFTTVRDMGGAPCGCGKLRGVVSM